jgi:transposase InsO family protein
VKRCCGWAQVNRGGYYRWLQPAQPDGEELELRNKIQKIAVQWPSYGYRRVRQELRDKYGLRVNHKRVLRLMREDNLLCLRRKAFWLPTTNSAHCWPVFANVAADMKGKLTGINQLWVADITYIRLEREYVYLAVVLDAYSRRVVGWALGQTLWRPCAWPWRSVARLPGWCIIPIAACSTLAPTIVNCSLSMGSAAA